MFIKIKNLKNEIPTKPYQVRIDRTSVLGNPFLMRNQGQQERDYVCDKYDEYFKGMLIDFTPFVNELHRLIQIYQTYGCLELFCWCAPKRCHGDRIAKYVTDFIEDNERFAENLLKELQENIKWDLKKLVLNSI